MIADAGQEKSSWTEDKQNFKECVAVSLYTMQGGELNSIARNNRPIEKTNIIPEGWTVFGVTTKTETGNVAPYMVICR